MSREHGQRSKPIMAVACAAAAVAAAVYAGSSVHPGDGLKWTAANIPGVSTAEGAGDMKAGASRFYLKYAAGFVAPLHHHTPDHFVSTISGTLVLIVDGKENKLVPGSYFSLTDKAPHAARCEGTEDCVMFVEAHGPWDVVAEPAKP